MIFKKTKILIFMFLCIALTTTSAFATTKMSEKPTYYPATESTINGVPESEVRSPNWVSDPVFVSYSASTPKIVNNFKLIADIYKDNRANSQNATITLTVQKSTEQGSEWNGNVSFNASIKAGMIGEITKQVSGGVKEFRVTNEAVGASSTDIVPARKQAILEAYYRGWSSNGTVNYKFYDDYSSKWVNSSVSAGAIVHPKHLSVAFPIQVW